jgi:hypothetical protein
MLACITLFEAIDPDCIEIETFAGGERDTGYVKRPEGWEAIDAIGAPWGHILAPGQFTAEERRQRLRRTLKDWRLGG